MSDDLPILPAATADETPPRASPPPRPERAARSGGAGVAWLIALIALAAAGFAAWRVHVLEQGQSGEAAALRNELDARATDPARAADQRKRDLDTLRTRIADADGVNKSLREEVLGIGERSRHLEDAVANLAEQRLSGRDALAMNEAEFLLQQAQQRLALFHDMQAAMTAYHLADSALAAAEDPVFAPVRQTIGAELAAMGASKSMQTDAALAALERLRTDLPKLAHQPSAQPAAAAPSRWQAFLAQFVRVSHDGEAGAIAPRELEITRALSAMDLRAAEAAVLARDDTAYKAALARARAGVSASFDANADATKAALAEIDRLSATPLAPDVPELGSALKELRNLRATRALSQPKRNETAPPASAAPAAPSGAGT